MIAQTTFLGDTAFYDKIAEDSKQALIQLVSEAGHGKALAIDTPIPTIDGWKMIGNVQVGDRIFDEGGNLCNVILTSPIRYDHDVYELEFDDGSIIKADSEHLWITSTRNSRLAEYRRKNKIWKSKESLYSIKTTKEIKNTLRIQNKNATNHAIPTTKPLTLPLKKLPIDPYILGVWLGDGTSSNGAITIIDEEILDHIRERGYKLKQWNNKKGVRPHNIIGLHTILKKNNLINNKHIPKEYLRSSIEQRLELLRGLLDTDGTVSKDHDTSYCTTDEQLAEDVSELLHGLGIKHRFVVHEAKLYGRVIGKRYRFRFSINEKLFYVKRKQNRINEVVRPTRKLRYIVKVKKIESEPVRCIGVDSQSHLFLAGKQMIPTHNTSSLRTIIDYCRKKHPDIVFKIFDVSQAWYHCAPTKWRQYVTLEKLRNNQVANIEDCVYEIGSLPPEHKRAFVGTIIGTDYEKRYQAKMENKGSLKGWSNLVYIFEEANIYFGSYSMRANDPYTPVFTSFVSVGRNYKMRGFLIATAEEGEISPGLRRRSRRIYGRLESEGDLRRIRRKDKEMANYLKEIPRYHFVYYADKAYGPIRVPDIVKNVPQDYEVEVVEKPDQFNANWWIRFGIGAGITLMAVYWVVNYRW